MGVKEMKLLGQATTCASILISAFIISVVYSAQNIYFEISQDVDVKWKGKNVTISVPIYLKNLGFYDINHVNVLLQLRDDEGRILAQNLNFLGHIEAGSEYRGCLTISLNLINFLLNEYWYDVISYRSFELKATVSLNYAFSSLSVKANSSVILTPELLVKGLLRYLMHEYSVNLDDPTFQYSGEDITVILPFTINYTGRLPIKDLQLKVQIKDSNNSNVGVGEVKIEKLDSSKVKVALNIILDKEISLYQLVNIANITIYLRANLDGFTIEWTKNIDCTSQFVRGDSDGSQDY